jgi:ubiquinone biosynthesis protein
MIFLANIRRLAHIVFVIIRHTLLHFVGMVAVRKAWLARFLNLKLLTGPQRLRTMFEDVGGTFLKFGQMLALQPDILSIEYCNELFNLLDRVKPVDYEDVERIFVEELRKKPEEVFGYIEREPLATASIGQVHVGFIEGRKYAVKVQRPMVEVDFAGDIRLMSATIRLIKALRLHALYWVIEPMSEFLAWTKEELDYRCEARYMQQLRRNASGNLNERVPEVLWNYTTRRTLVMEFFDGHTLLSYLRALETGDEIMQHRLSAKGFDPNATARNIIDNFLGDVFQHGIFHADLHPANLMILENNVVGYIDFGITGTISRYSRQNLIALTLAYTRGDLEGMCDAFFKVSVTEDENSIERFKQGLLKLSAGWYEIEGRERRLRKNFTLVMLDMLRLSRSAGVWPERDVIKYIRSAIAIDGLITRFAPAFNLSKHLQEVCGEQLRWNARHALMNYDSLLDWAIANGRVMREGPFKVTEIIRRLIEGNGHDVSASDGENEKLGRKAVRLGAVMLLASLMISLTGEKSAPAFNLFTAELMFLGFAAMQLMRTIKKLA